MSYGAVAKAVAFAEKKHRGQFRKGGNPPVPYVTHPLRVFELLAVNGVTDEVTLVAALLHDTLEDTGTDAKEITMWFGSEVTGVVLELSDDKTLSKDERQKAQLARAPKMSLRAKQIKAADKTANVTDLLDSPPPWSPAVKLRYADHAELLVSELDVGGVIPGVVAEFGLRVRALRASLAGE